MKTKILKATPSYSPIQITLETKEEFDILYALLNLSHNKIKSVIDTWSFKDNDIMFKMFEAIYVIGKQLKEHNG